MQPALEPTARRELYLLIARLLGREIDVLLYRRLVATQGDALRWIEPELTALSEDVAVEALETEYCRLLVGPNPACPPFSSVARGEALLGGRARSRLGDVLASLGLAVDASARIASPDHVAIVFAVLAELSDRDAIRTCLRDLVLPWVPAWLSALERNAGRDLFRAVARVASALIDEERAALNLTA